MTVEADMPHATKDPVMELREVFVAYHGDISVLNGLSLSVAAPSAFF